MPEEKKSIEVSNYYYCFSDNAGLGGGADGYFSEFATDCSLPLKYADAKLAKTINSAADLGFTDEYMTAFQPHGYVKMWIR